MIPSLLILTILETVKLPNTQLYSIRTISKSLQVLHSFIFYNVSSSRYPVYSPPNTNKSSIPGLLQTHLQPALPQPGALVPPVLRIALKRVGLPLLRPP